MNRATDFVVCVSALSFAMLVSGAFAIEPAPIEYHGKPLQQIFAAEGRVFALYGAGSYGREWVSLSTDTVRRLRLPGGAQLLSPSRGRYFYVEVLPAFVDGVIEPNTADINPRIHTDAFRDWDNNPPGMRVHVHRLSGEEVATVDLPNSYCGNYGEGQWLGEKWIWLRHRSGHRSGNFYSLFVNVDTGEKRVMGWTIRKAAAGDDGRFLAFEYKEVLYVNFRPVFPIYGEEISDFGSQEGWESFKQKYLVRKEKLPHEQLAGADVRVHDFLFAPDGRRLIVLGRDPRRPVPGKPNHIIPRELAVLNLAQIAKTRDPKRYSHLISLPADSSPRTLRRDDKTGEIQVLDAQPGVILWRQAFDELGRSK